MSFVSEQLCKPKPGPVFFACAVLTLVFSSLSANEREGLQHEQQKLYRVMQLKLLYSAEIFDYCIERHGAGGSRLEICMQRQNKIKDGLFASALRQLGQHSLVQPMYEECADFYPNRGVSRIGDCVRTRLKLRDKLDDEVIEREIYRRCDEQWRDHGAAAITNCSIHDANYYRKNGFLRD